MKINSNWLINKNNWSGFLANLLGVIVGIVLTFGGNALWQKHEENKKTKEILILVRNELETNKEWFKDQENTMREDAYVFKKILEINGDYSSLPMDTLSFYISRTMRLKFNQLTTSAWQILQNSDMIQKMSNKELVIRLTECYYWINKMESFILTEYWDNKKKAIPAELDPYKYFEVVMNNKESVFFYSFMNNSDIWNLFPTIDAIIDYTILLLDKYGDFNYNMRAQDEEFESFIKTRIDSLSQKNNTISKEK